MRKTTVLIATIVALLMALVSTPAHANTYDPTTGSGTVNCVTSGATTGSGFFTVTNFVVSSHSGCAGNAIIPASVTSLGTSAFIDATQLVTATFNSPSSLVTIGDGAFNNTTSLTSITIPASVTSIGISAFSGATRLAAVTFADPSSLTTIGNDAFFITALTSIAIPASVTSIGIGAFVGATRLATVTFADPSSLTTIGISAFDGATALTSITIPASVTSIGEFAFAEANILNNLTFRGAAPTVGAGAFMATLLTHIDVFAETSGWGATFSDSSLPVRRSYLASFDTNSGTQVSSQRFSSASSLVEPAAPTRAGFTFDGWSATDGGSRITFPFNPGATSNVTIFARWIQIPVVVPPTVNTPTIDLVAQAAAADLVARTIKSKSRFAIKPLASRVGVPMVSPRARVTFSVAKASRKVCTKSGSRLRTLRPGNCVVTFTVAEPKPKKGKKPKASKTVKTLVVQQ